MWLTSSSIGRKFVMALTGIALVLFVTFHCLMNAVAIAWPTAYNVICEFLGANWYAVVASVGLAALFIIHIIYALMLTVQNRKARGGDRYAVTSRPPQVEWSSKNMLVLGIVILAFLVVHLIQFWAKMQWMEIRGLEYTTSDTTFAPQFGTLFIQAAFEQVWTPIVYIIGFVALWFHLNHGFWSMFHSVGWDDNHWLKRLKCIGCWWVTIVVGLFIAQAIVFTVRAHDKHYLTDIKLQEQYAEHYVDKMNHAADEYFAGLQDIISNKKLSAVDKAEGCRTVVESFGNQYEKIAEEAKKICPDAMHKLHTNDVEAVFQSIPQLQQMLQNEIMQEQLNGISMQDLATDGLEDVDVTILQ